MPEKRNTKAERGRDAVFKIPAGAPWSALTPEELGQHVSELRRANEISTGSRKAALNLLEDAVEARQRAEDATAALAESEQRFRSLVEAHAQAVWETNAAGEVEVDSPSWRMFTGQSLKEWRGLGWLNAIHPDDRTLAECRWREAVATRQSLDLEFRLRHSEGGYRWTNARATPIFAPDGSVRKWSGMNIDITARKNIEEELRRREEELVQVQKVGEVGGVDIDITGGLTARRSPEYRRLHGLPEGVQEETHADWLDRVHSEDRAAADQALRNALESRADHYESEYRIIRPSDGQVRWIQAKAVIFRDPEGAAMRLVGAHIDITERKNAEQVLRASAWRQDFLLKLGDVLRTLSDPKRILVEASKLLGEYLRADRAGYAEAQPDGETVQVGTHYVSDVPRIEGTYRYADYGEGLLREFLAGRTVIRPDIANDPLLSDREKSAHASLALGATINKPLVKGGTLLAILFVHFRGAHPFQAAEVELVEETAERTWAAVERARTEEALRESEKRYRTLFESIDEGFCLVEMLFDNSRPQDYRFLEANPAFEMQTGLTDVVGRTARELVPSLEDSWFEIYGRIALTGEAHRFTQASGAMGRCYDVYAFRVGEPEQRRVAVLFNDIMDRKIAEEAMAADLRDTQLLRELGARFVSPAETLTLYGEINEAAVLLARADAGTVQIYDEAAESLTLIAARGFPSEVWQRFAKVRAGSSTSCGRAMASGTRALVDFQQAPSDPHGDLAWHRDAGFSTAQSTPLVSRGGQPIGMLSTHWRRSHQPTERELRYLDLLARQAADLIEQRETEKRIIESEARLQTLANEVPQIIWTNDSEGSADYFNKRWYEFSGRSPEESVGLGWEAIVHPDDASSSRLAWRTALHSGTAFDCEYRLRRADGEYRWFIGRNIPLRDGEGRILSWFGTATDIHDLKEAEAAMRASEEQFRRAVQEAPIPVIMLAEDGQVFQISRTWTELTGYTPEDMKDFESWMNRAYGEGAKLLRQHMQQLFHNRLPTVNVELDVRTQHGNRRRWAFSASAPGVLVDGRRFVVGMALDVTERKRAEDALRESQERLRLIVENARDYAIFSMDLNRTVTSWNSGAENLLGYTQDEILGRSGDVIFSSEDRRAKAPEIEAQTAISTGRASDERWHLRKNGTPFWGSGVMMAMHDSEGQTIGLVKIFRDQTETRAAQKALEESQAELMEALQENEAARREVEAASRAKDHFLAVLSHELRTPLSPVLLTTMTLQRRSDLPAPIAKGLEMIRRNVQLECHLIDDLLDLTRIARGKLEIVREPVDLHEVIRNAVEISRPDVDAKKQHMDVELGADRTMVIGDSTRLPQLIWNLLKNASKFTPANGWIHLATRRRGERIVVKISDSGAGIRPEKLAVIFDAFIQAEESTFTEFGGLGLGLAIAKATVEAHEGTIEATSAGPGRGSSFFFELPLASGEALS